MTKTTLDLERLRAGAGSHLKQYIADVRSANGLDIVIQDGLLKYRGLLAGR